MTNKEMKMLFRMQWTHFKGVWPIDMEEFVKESMTLVPFAKWDIRMIEEPKFEPYQRILVRNSGEQKWKPTLFSHYDEQGRVRDVCFHEFEMAITYEGHEDLAGTKKSED